MAVTLRDWMALTRYCCSVGRLDPPYSMASNHEFHCPTPKKSAMVASTAVESGKMSLTKMTRSLAPSMRAESSISAEKPRKKESMMNAKKALNMLGMMYTRKL